MGLADLTERIKNAENSLDYVRRWVNQNSTLLSSVSAFDARISDLEGNITSAFTDRLKDYVNIFTGKKNEHGFIYFTDPHDLDESFTSYEILLHMHFYKTIYENTPARYVLCGGDWINTKHTLKDAKYFIARVPNLMREEITKNSYSAVGNHDLNIEGNYTELDRILREDQLAYLWHGKEVGYFTVDYEDTRCYIFDSGTQENEMTEYRWKQVDWFANSLLTNTVPHLFGLIHLIYINKDKVEAQTEYALGDYLTQVANAFNQRTSITLNGETYDFSSATGTVQFMLSGHYHNTQQHIYNGIPVIWSPAGRIAECCHVDFDSDKLKIVRMYMNESTEVSREIDIIPFGTYSTSTYAVTKVSAMRSSDSLTNNYGTTINSLTYTGEIVVTQTIGDAQNPDAGQNGYFHIFAPLTVGNRYRIKADIEFTNKNADHLVLYPNVQSTAKKQMDIVDGHIDADFTHAANGSNNVLQIYCCGNSFKMKNVRIYDAS